MKGKDGGEVRERKRGTRAGRRRTEFVLRDRKKKKKTRHLLRRGGLGRREGGKIKRGGIWAVPRRMTEFAN